MAELDLAIASVDATRFHDLVLVTLVRGTYPFRAGLPGWVAFRDRVGAEFGARGHVVEDALYGLL